MLTIEKLKAYGADVREGLERCVNNEAFYLGLVAKVLPDRKLDELEEAIGRGDLDAAFEIAHTLKGLYGNLSLTPLYVPVCEMTEYLRSRTETDYSALLAEAKAQKEKLDALAAD
ncbi:MAG: Hpt domain-containing protein [Oscillibacter sp.]|nr:Hpt domain-containing protein [Oscillibacter sp.]